MATALDFIKLSLKDIGVLAAGEDPSYDDSNDALEHLNSLLDQWEAQRLKIYTITRTTWTIVASTGTYTAGTGGNITSRPAYIQNAAFIDTSQTVQTEQRMPILTEWAWQNLRQKTLTSNYPQVLYYNPTFPLGSITLWPIPTSSTLTGVIYWPQPVGQIAALTTTINVPSGYKRMMTKALALELCPSYGVQPSQELQKQATDAMASVKRMNKRLRDLEFDPGILIDARRPAYNIWTD